MWLRVYQKVEGADIFACSSADFVLAVVFNQSIKTNVYSAMRRKRIRGR